MTTPKDKSVLFCLCVNAAVLAFASLFLFLLPAAIESWELTDANIRSPGIPASAWRLHRSLSPRYERWARARLDSSRATELSTSNISGTEWPLFGSVFYLWATESLQDAWAKNPPPGTTAPNIHARDAIDAATRLVIDPRQANWVKTHWGDKYLTTENVFYRMLVIAALTSHNRLTGDKQFLPQLKGQVESFSAELDASRFGLLDDYPGECYPGDVLTAIAMIKRADAVLGTDHSAFINRAIRGFQAKALDRRGLVPYSATATIGVPDSTSRGCGNSYVSLFSPEVWPEQARQWYDLYTRHFWQEKWTCAGFREFPRDVPDREWYFDVDSGPVLGGFGCAACAFGVGAARVNGHFEHAYPLTAQMTVTSWPLPNGTRLLPRLLSNAADAPYLGEAAILFNLTRMPATRTTVTTGGTVPWFALIFLSIQIAIGAVLLVMPIRLVQRLRRGTQSPEISRPGLQCGIWWTLIIISVCALLMGRPATACIPLLAAQLLPQFKRSKQKPVPAAPV